MTLQIVSDAAVTVVYCLKAIAMMPDSTFIYSCERKVGGVYTCQETAHVRTLNPCPYMYISAKLAMYISAKLAMYISAKLAMYISAKLAMYISAKLAVYCLQMCFVFQ